MKAEREDAGSNSTTNPCRRCCINIVYDHKNVLWYLGSEKGRQGCVYFPTKRGDKLKIPRILKDLRVSRQVMTEGTQKNYFSHFFTI